MKQIARLALAVVVAVVIDGCGETCKGYPPYFAPDDDGPRKKCDGLNILHSFRLKLLKFNILMILGQCMPIACGKGTSVDCKKYNNDDYPDVRCVREHFGII